MKTAMLLAAGRGDRLKPLTNHIPKALCEVGGKPLIIWHIERLVRAGFQHIVINHAWLGWKIRHLVGNGNHFGAHVEYAAEPPGGLETGGGIFNALPLLGTEPFLTVNADLFTDFDFRSARLADEHWLHLVLVQNPAHNPRGDFGLDAQGMLTNSNTAFTAAGITCYHPLALAGLRPGRYRIAPLWRELADRNRASGKIFSGVWLDIGTRERLNAANTFVFRDWQVFSD